MKMKMKNVSVTLLVFVLGEVIWCEGCWKEEGEALSGLNSRFGFLMSWQWEGTDCCEWEGVQCNSSTGRVSKLDLSSVGFISSDWQVSYAYLVVFKDLKSLSLSGNSGILNCTDSEGLENLEILDLSFSGMHNVTDILVCMNGLPSLKSLYLSYSSFPATLNDFETLSSKLVKLEVLDLSHKSLTKDVLPSLGGFTSLKELYLSDNELDSDNHIQGLCSMLKNLEVFDLSYNNFNNTDIASALSELSSLKSLNLGNSQLTPRSILNISKLRSLEILGIEGNQLNERILGRLEKDGFTWPPNLQVLRLGSNSFSNEFLSSLTWLQRLKFLDLSRNQLNGSLDISGLLALTSLEILDLSYNQINSFVIHQVSGSKSLSKLDVLTLDGNMINGSNLRESLQPFSSIRVVSMNENKIIGTITAGDFRDLSNLQHLALDKSCGIENEFFRSIGELTSLKVLSASECQINGTLPPAGWFKLKNLEELDLSQNLFVGTLPSFFLNMTSLSKLELSENQFSGQFDSNIGSLTSLEYFGYTENQFEVPISFTPFANHSNLKFIYGEGNKVILDIPHSLQTWIPKFQLQVLSLSSTTDNDSLPLPRFLLHQNHLTSIDFTSCRLEGVFPHWLIENNTKLTEILIRNCSFTDILKLPLHPRTSMKRIDVSDNNITGQISNINISSILPNLQFLDLSINHIQGSIPVGFGKMSLLDTLDLSDNYLSGEIPKNISEDGSMLKYLKLSHNKLDGRPIFPTSKYLEQLYLDDNNLYGSIPNSLFNSSLILLDLSYNNLAGKLPSVVGNFSILMTLSLSNNHLKGFIPKSLVELDHLLYIDISHNNLMGFVPSLFNASLFYIHMSNNRLTGLSKRMFSKNSVLIMIDLSYNEIASNIQDMIHDLADTVLNILVLKDNRFTGHLPNQLCQLVDLSLLDLSYNNIFGPIPNCLGKMPFENHNPDSLWAAFDGFPNVRDCLGCVIPNMNEKADFTTKKISYTYTGGILAYMSGIDLSKNKLNGSIPSELGNLTRLRALNLSHNDLIGQIPSSFSNLVQVESLDLSFNMLSGQIPPQLNQLSSLAVFSVAHNNLSGDIAERKGQFITFDESSYEGNSLLCGPPLLKSCHPYAQSPTISSNDEDNDSPVDMLVFCVSFVVAYTSVLLVMVVILYINPYWRQAWFFYMELIILTCYYFMEDSWRRFFKI